MITELVKKCIEMSLVVHCQVPMNCKALNNRRSISFNQKDQYERGTDDHLGIYMEEKDANVLSVFTVLKELIVHFNCVIGCWKIQHHVPGPQSAHEENYGLVFRPTFKFNHGLTGWPSESHYMLPSSS